MNKKQLIKLASSADRRQFLKASGALGLASAIGGIPEIVYA